MREIAAWRYVRPRASERNTISWNRLPQAELPTPYHPKIVSMYKVPYPLPDIELDFRLPKKSRMWSIVPGIGKVSRWKTRA